MGAGPAPEHSISLRRIPFSVRLRDVSGSKERYGSRPAPSRRAGLTLSCHSVLSLLTPRYGVSSSSLRSLAVSGSQGTRRVPPPLRSSGPGRAARRYIARLAMEVKRELSVHISFTSKLPLISQEGEMLSASIGIDDDQSVSLHIKVGHLGSHYTRCKRIEITCVCAETRWTHTGGMNSP